MNVKFLNPFVEAANEVLEIETHLKASRGELHIDKDVFVTNGVAVIISLVGRVEGNVFFSMDEKTATNLASRILGEPLSDFNTLAQSGVAELGNVITGRAGVKLAAAGYESNISVPTLLRGQGSFISTLGYSWLVVPLVCDAGPLVIHLALREKSLQAG